MDFEQAKQAAESRESCLPSAVGGKRSVTLPHRPRRRVAAVAEESEAAVAASLVKELRRTEWQFEPAPPGVAHPLQL